MSRWARIAFEIAAGGLACYAIFMTLVIGMLTSTWVWVVGAAAYVVLWRARVVAWRNGRVVALRAWIDCGLAALVPALALAIPAVKGRWPLRGRSYDAHGWGRSGGEDNWLFLPWLHVLFWLALLWVVRTSWTRAAA